MTPQTDKVSAGEMVAVAMMSLLLAPIIGLMLMLGLWNLIVDTGGRGGIDYGVILFGAAGAVLLTGWFARACGLSSQAASGWMAATFLTTFVIPVLLIWLLFALSTGGGAGGVD